MRFWALSPLGGCVFLVFAGMGSLGVKGFEDHGSMMVGEVRCDYVA